MKRRNEMASIGQVLADLMPIIGIRAAGFMLTRNEGDGQPLSVEESRGRPSTLDPQGSEGERMGKRTRSGDRWSVRKPGKGRSANAPASRKVPFRGMPANAGNAAVVLMSVSMCEPRQDPLARPRRGRGSHVMIEGVHYSPSLPSSSA